MSDTGHRSASIGAGRRIDRRPRRTERSAAQRIRPGRGSMLRPAPRPGPART